jgi:ABC-type Na+ transport system ATPase subunit NatA
MLRNLLDDLSFYIKTSHIKRLIGILTKNTGSQETTAKMLAVLLTSSAFKAMYY